MEGTLKQVLTMIAEDYDFAPHDLITYSHEDKLGGYHPDPNNRNYPGNANKGIWEVEGKILYALIRALRPTTVLEIGNEWGNSTRHVIAALRANKHGHLYTMDIKDSLVLDAEEYEWATPIVSDLFLFNYESIAPIDFVFEDTYHTCDMVGHIWRKFKQYGGDNAMIMSHDAKHPAMQAGVIEGIKTVTDGYTTYLAEPSDCGFALWRKE